MHATSLRYQALIELLHTAEEIWSASRSLFAPWNLSPSQFNLLNLLHLHPDGLSQSELSRRLLMHRSNATGLLDRLEQRQLVRRAPDPADRRAHRVVLTPAGRSLVEEIRPSYHDAAERVWTGIPDARIRQWIEDLKALAATASSMSARLQQHPGSSPAAFFTAPNASPIRPRAVSRTRAGRRPPSNANRDLPPPGELLRTSDL